MALLSDLYSSDSQGELFRRSVGDQGAGREPRRVARVVAVRSGGRQAAPVTSPARMLRTFRSVIVDNGVADDVADRLVAGWQTWGVAAKMDPTMAALSDALAYGVRSAAIRASDYLRAGSDRKFLVRWIERHY